MGRHARIPASLTRNPFTLSDAARAGLKRWHLEGARWRRVGPSTYIDARLTDSPMLQLNAAALRLPAGGAFSGMTAAWLHGLDVPACDPIEITVPKEAGAGARTGMALRRARLAKGEIVKVRGLPATSIVRTVRDVCARLELAEAVVLCDMALHARMVTEAELHEVASRCSGARGIATLRDALVHIEPAAESPMESRLRMLLVLAGLPRPEAQVPVRDRWHRFIGRPDLFYRLSRLGLEYDGGTHRESLAEDNRRQNRLLDAGVRLLRFTAGDIFNTPDVVVSQVRSALGA